jgi:uncharacterized protein (TIGR03067 family)
MPPAVQLGRSAAENDKAARPVAYQYRHYLLQREVSMFRRASVIVFAAPLLWTFAALAAQDSPNDKDKKSLQGKWELHELYEGGKGPQKDPGVFLTFDGDRIVLTAEKKDVSATFTLDAGKTPKTMDTKSVRPGFFGAPWIYELKDDDLKICGGKVRPKALTSTREDNQSLFVFKRVKK